MISSKVAALIARSGIPMRPLLEKTDYQLRGQRCAHQIETSVNALEGKWMVMVMAAITATTKAATAKKKKQALALHVKSGETHVVGIGNLRVVIIPDGNYFFAQGLEIDYAAQGDSLPSVKENFENGLRATIEQHCRIHGTIKPLLKAAPPDVWFDLLGDPAARGNYYSQISVHKINQLPFEGIQYVVAKAAAAAMNA